MAGWERLLRLVEDDIGKQLARYRGEQGHALPRNLPVTLLLDFIIGQVVIGPLVTSCWRAAWRFGDIIVDEVLLPGHPVVGVLSSCVVGTGVCMSLVCFQNYVSILSSHPNLAVHLLVSRTFTVVYFCSYMLFWRGWWGVMLLVASPAPLVTATGILCMVATGSMRTNVGFPLVIGLDTRSGYVSVPTFLGTGTEKQGPSFLDAGLTSGVEVLAVMCWFGLWTTQDIIIAKITNNYTFDSFISLVSGILSGLCVFLLQFPALLLHHVPSSRSPPYLVARPLQHPITRKLLVDDLLAGLGLFSTVSNLRAVWRLLDHFVLTNHPWASLLVTGFGGAIGLTCLGTATSLHGGVARDASEQSGLILPGFYLTYWLSSPCTEGTFMQTEDTAVESERLTTAKNLQDGEQ